MNYLNSSHDFSSSSLINCYDELPLWAAPFGFKILDNLDYKKNINILDVGVGTGFPVLEIAQRFGDSSKVYGIDIWSEAFDRVKYKAATYGISNLTLNNYDIEETPFESNAFDIVTSNNGINNVENPQKAIEECYRLCKKDGQFIFTTNLEDTMFEFYDILKLIAKEKNNIKLLENIDDHIYKKRKSVKQTVEILTKVGFKNITTIQDSFSLYFSSAQALFNHYFIQIYFLKPWIDLVGNERSNEYFALLENRIEEDINIKGHFNLTIPYCCFNCYK